MGALNLMSFDEKDFQGAFATAKTVTELLRNYKIERINTGLGKPSEEEMKVVETVVRDLLANRFAVIMDRLDKGRPRDEIKTMLTDILKRDSE